MGLLVPGYGPADARVMLVGEAPGEDEEVKGKPFVGASGKTLDALLRDAGINRDECFVTNVSQYRPPDNEMSKWLVEQKPSKAKKPSTKPSKAGKVYADKGYTLLNGRWAHPHVIAGRQQLLEDIDRVCPQLIIGFGNTPLWALTGNWGISKWRGSEIVLGYAADCHFVPTLHPAALLRNWAARPQVLHDLTQRCAKRLREGFYVPAFNFNIQPTFEDVIACIDSLEGDVLGDIETSNGTTICLGLAWSPLDAICIPFRGPDGAYWTYDEQVAIIEAIKRKRPFITWIGQNWNYDAQYIEEDFRYKLMADFDTLIAQSVLYPGVERKLGFLSSMYCEWHQYWKEDAKDWSKILDFNGLFRYNCRDCCANWEVAQAHKILLKKARLESQFKERMEYSYHVYEMMRNGVNRDPTRTAKMIGEVDEAICTREVFMQEKTGREMRKITAKKVMHFFDSPTQVADLFYKQLGCKVQIDRKTKKPTVDDEALTKLSEMYPEHEPLALAILECRSLRSLKSNFLEAAEDPDGKFRSSWMATGAKSFRLTSSGNAFYRGGPLQNLTDGEHTHSGRPLPNLRSCIVPSPGHTIFNCDLERADLQVVAWEAEDEDLKWALRHHADMHLINAVNLFDIRGLPLDECIETHPNYIDHKKRHGQKRHFAKTFVHLTDYAGKARTCAEKVHCTVHEADLAQRRWFALHPGIKRWHQRTQASLMAFRTATNKFGYQIIYFDRIEGVLSDALAWIPQSTVAILISLIQMRMNELAGADISIIMQGHDSVVGEYLTTKEGVILPKLYEAGQIIVPYPDPLYIPLELSISTSSWGEVEKRPWPTPTEKVALTG